MHPNALKFLRSPTLKKLPNPAFPRSTWIQTFYQNMFEHLTDVHRMLIDRTAPQMWGVGLGTPLYLSLTGESSAKPSPDPGHNLSTWELD